ncbi:MAG: carboxypeptidase regulatory-like domain-containing protein, partial [Pyrinomonadaceae bacterium]|nr:carboxypeptidase regulatory-like domain-containing protein [Pyrinomonadaceae bacterium]
MRSLFLNAAGCLLIMIMATAAYAQSSGVVRGSVADASGAAVVGASVTLENANDNYRQTVSSDKEGRYTFVNVPFNSYTLTVTQAGFTAARDEVALRTSLPVERDITLAVAVSGGQANEPTPIS